MVFVLPRILFLSLLVHLISSTPDRRLVKRPASQGSAPVCGAEYGRPSLGNCQSLVNGLFDQMEIWQTVAHFEHFVGYHEQCKITIDPIGVRYVNFPWSGITGAIQAILASCTVHEKGGYGGTQTIGPNNNIRVSVKHPLAFDDVDTTPANSGYPVGQWTDDGAQAMDTETGATGKRKCREFDPPVSGPSHRPCVRRCNGEALGLANVLYGLRQAVALTVFSCGNLMAGIVEVGSGS